MSHPPHIAASTFCVGVVKRGRALRQFERRLNLSPKGSVAYKCGLVAAGCYEGVFFVLLVDICAGVAIIEAAGGRVTDRQGRPYRFNRPDPLKTPDRHERPCSYGADGNSP